MTLCVSCYSGWQVFLSAGTKDKRFCERNAAAAQHLPPQCLLLRTSHSLFCFCLSLDASSRLCFSDFFFSRLLFLHIPPPPLPHHPHHLYFTSTSWIEKREIWLTNLYDCVFFVLVLLFYYISGWRNSKKMPNRALMQKKWYLSFGIWFINSFFHIFLGEIFPQKILKLCQPQPRGSRSD